MQRFHKTSNALTQNLVVTKEEVKGEVMVRAKLQVSKVAKTNYGGTEVTLSAIYDTTIPEDQRFSKATPSASFTMFIDNPPAAEYLELGKYFYVDFTKAEQ
jgi:hypothetical protein